MSSWEEYKKKRKEESSWEKYKTKRENLTKQESNQNNNLRRSGEEFTNRLKIQGRSLPIQQKTTPTYMKKESLWDTIKKITNKERNFKSTYNKNNSMIYTPFLEKNQENKDEELQYKLLSNKKTQTHDEFLERLSNMNNAQRVKEIRAITKNEKDFNKLNLEAIQYKQSKEASQKAEKINQDIDNGNYISAVGHILGGVPTKALDSITTTVSSMPSILPSKKINSSQIDGDELLKVNKILSKKYEETTSNIDSDIVKTASSVSGTIGAMTPSILSNLMIPGSGKIVQAVNASADAYQETLNDNADNKTQALLTGIAKGGASYAIEGITGGNFLGKGSLDDIAKKTISNNLSSPISKRIASKLYEVGGEIFEEEIENQAGYVIDKIINNKDVTAKEWWNDASETAKNTLLTTVVLNLLGLGGNTYNEILKNENDTQIKKMAKQAENIIKKENLKVDINNTQSQENVNKINSQNIENQSENVYNNLERESGFNEINKPRQGDTRLLEQYGTRIQQENQHSENQRKFTKTEYEQWEKSIKPINDRNITNEQKRIKSNIKRQYGKNIVFFYSEDADYNGGASLTNPSDIYINIKDAEEFGINKMSLHEVIESDILHNESLKQDVILPTIKKIITDPNFEQQKINFWKGQTGIIPSDYAIAKDIIADRFAEIESGESLDYINNLSQETNMTIDYAIENFRNQLSNSKKVKLPTQENILPYKTSSNINKDNHISEIELFKEETKKLNLPTSKDINNKVNTELLTDEDYKVLNDIYEKEGRTEILTEKRKANILEKYANDKYTFKNSLDILAQKFINKGHFVDKLSEQAKNPELKFLYDRNLNSFAEGQYVIGIAQTDNNGNKIGKSINDIWKPVEDSKLTKEFSEYLLHKLNIDRGERNKFVFGKEIGPTESTKIALELENKHPEFKRYAQDIKNFNHNNLSNLKEAGLITQETIDYLEKLYPYYVPISRDKDGKIFVGDNERTGTNLPIKKATGGSSDIQPIKDTMAQQAIRIKRLINQNKLGQELAKTLKNAKVEQQADIQYTPDELLAEYKETLVDADNEGNKYYTYFEDGYMQKLKISDELYESLKPTEINDLEKTGLFRGLQKFTNIHRSLLTSSNPVFIVSNFFKDIQDGMFNSKYSSKFIKNYGKALHEIITKGKYYESYMANGGMTNTYFDYNEGIKNKRNKFVEKIRSTNEIVEQLPRLSEFISTLEDGKSLNEALYNAAEITTNFKRGGEITKAINRNGVNFLNASIQGLDKQFRNFSGQNGAKGYANLLLKATLLGVVPSVLNHILLGDDEDYEDLPESTKDLYYIFKYDDGKFIRIPKGRVLSIFGSSARRILEALQGKENSFDGFTDTLINQMAPNNPLEDNIFAPIAQAVANKTWYGEDLVSSRLQKELPKNQFDETTDKASIMISNAVDKLPNGIKSTIQNIPILNNFYDILTSPKKLNYVIDQYSGGLGDVVLPMMTPQAKQNVFKDKFTTDSIMKNKNVGKFYETLEKQSQIANDSFATDEDKLQSQYLSEISGDMSDLYKEKREIQMRDISNSEKTEKVREIQEKINKLAEKGLSEYSSGTYKKNSAKIGDIEYYKDGKGKWVKLTEEEKEKNKNISTETYATYKQKIYKETQDKDRTLKNTDKIQILLNSKYSEKEIGAIYENYIKSESDIEYNIMKTAGIDTKEYLKYKQQEFTSDKKDDGTLAGKTISKSKQNKVVEYLNSMKITGNQRLLLYAIQGYSTTSSQKKQLANYVQGLNLDKETKLKLYDKFSGFTVYKNGRVTW